MRVLVSGLTTALAGLSQTQLEDLETFWEIDPDAVGRSADARTQKNSERLAAAMGTTWAAMAVVEKLSNPQRQALRRILDESPVHHTAFAELGESPETLLRPLLENLVVLMVHSWSYGGRGARWSGKMPLPKDAYIGVPGELRVPLDHALKLYDLPVEERILQPLFTLLDEVNIAYVAERLGMLASFSSLYASSLVGLVAGSLRRPEQVQKVLQKCSPRARRLFSELLKSDRPSPLRNLLSGPSVGAQEVLPLLSELSLNALVFPLFVGGKRACFIPGEVADAARGKAPQRPVISDALEPVAAPEHLFALGQGTWWNVMVAGLAIEAGRGEVTSTTHEIPRKVIKQLAKSAAASINDPGDGVVRMDRALYWLEKFRLVELRGNKIQPADRWQQWRTSSLPEQAVLVLNSWIFEDENEFNVLLPGVANPAMAFRRARLKSLKWLQELPPGEWLTVDSFLQRVLARDPYFLRSREAILTLMGEAGIDDLYASWRRQDGAILLNELYSAPLTAGFIEVGWETEPKSGESPTCLRVSSFGGEILRTLQIVNPPPEKIDAPGGAAPAAGSAARKPGRPRSPIAVPRKSELSLAEFFHENRIRLKEGSQQEERVLLVQPNLEVVLLQFNPRAAYAVGRFAQPVRFDQVGTFQITAESVRSAASRGIEFSEMKAALDRYGTGPTPQNVEYQMNDWAGAVRKVRFERGTVVEVDSPEDLDTLLSGKSMRSRLIRRLSPTMALLSVGEDVKALGTILEPQGFSWTPPEDWDAREEAAYVAIHKTLKRFESPKSSWSWKY